MIAMSRTDRLRAEILKELEAQRPGLDAGGPLSSVSVIAYFHASGEVRQVHFRADRKREVGDERRLRAPRMREQRHS
jgi:hypothetical protein